MEQKRDAKGRFLPSASSTNWINLINDAPPWALSAMTDKISGKIIRIEVDDFPMVGELVIGVPGDAANRFLYTPATSQIPELGVLRVEFWSTQPRDETGLGTMGPGLNGVPIRIYIGSEYTGIILQYEHSSRTWYPCFSHGNYGNNYCSGGTWGEKLGFKTPDGNPCREAFQSRYRGSTSHVFFARQHQKHEKYCVSIGFWLSAQRDLQKLGLI